MSQPVSYDIFAKELLRHFAEGWGPAVPREIPSDPQRGDLCFSPTEPLVEIEDRGLAARMFRTACLIEAFHNTPGLDLVLECLRKQLALYHRERLDPAPRAVAIPALWILSAGKPRRALAGLGFASADGWPEGVYRSPQPAVPAWIVAINELPPNAETLVWRLCGAGPVLNRALGEANQPGQPQWLRQLAWDMSLKINLESGQRPDAVLTANERDLRMVTEQAVEDWKRNLILQGKAEGEAKGKAEGEAKGKAEGEAKGKAEGEAKGKAEGKAEAILAIIQGRGLPVTEDERRAILACTDLAQLDAMLTRAIASSSVDEVLH